MNFSTEWVAPKEAAKILGKSESTIRKWIRDGKLKAANTYGGPCRIELDELSRFDTTGAVERYVQFVQETHKQYLSLQEESDRYYEEMMAACKWYSKQRNLIYSKQTELLAREFEG